MVVVSQQIVEFFFLAERCLITISNGKLEMHDLVQEMAFENVVGYEVLGMSVKF